MLNLEHYLYGAETWARRKINHKSLGSFEKWCSRRMEIILMDRVKNEVLRKVKGDRNILHTMRRKKANWTGQKWSWKFLLNHLIEGNLHEWEDKEGDVSSYSIVLRKTEDT